MWSLDFSARFDARFFAGLFGGESMRRTTILNASEVKRTLFREAEASFYSFILIVVTACFWSALA